MLQCRNESEKYGTRLATALNSQPASVSIHSNAQASDRRESVQQNHGKTTHDHDKYTAADATDSLAQRVRNASLNSLPSLKLSIPLNLLQTNKRHAKLTLG